MKEPKVHIEYKKYGYQHDKHPAAPVNLTAVKKIAKLINLHEPELYTFSTELLPAQLLKLWKGLIKGRFISADTSESHFVYMFSRQLLGTHTKPIKWISSKEAVRFLLESLNVPIHKQQVASCFIDLDGEPFLISKPNRTKAVGKTTTERLEKIIFSI